VKFCLRFSQTKSAHFTSLTCIPYNATITHFSIDYSNNKEWIMKPLIMKLHPLSSSPLLLGSNILLSVLFSNTLVSRLHNVRDTGLYPYKRTGIVIIPYILIFTFLRSRWNTKHSEPKRKEFSQISLFLKYLLLKFLFVCFFRKYLNCAPPLKDSLPYTSYN